MTTNITNLPVDVLSKIISTVAVLPDGAREVAKSMSTCQRFLEASESIVVLRAVSFQNVQVLDRCHLFQRRNGLLVKCAQSGNSIAEHLVAKLILATSTQLVNVNMSKARLNHFRDYSPKYKHSSSEAHDDAALASFMAIFVPSPELNLNLNLRPRPLSYHWQFVKLFMLKSTPREIQQLNRHLNHYIELFTPGGEFNEGGNFLYLVSLLFLFSSTNADVLHDCNDHIMYTMEDFILFLKTPNIEFPKWRAADSLFEEIRAKAVGALDEIIPILMSC